MVEKQSKRILPQLFSCIQKQKDITVITLLTIRKYQSIAFCIVKLPFWNMVRMDGSRDPLVSITTVPLKWTNCSLKSLK